jgi:hypothetical protein
MPASHFDVKPMTGRPKFIVRHSTMPAKKCHHFVISKKKIVIHTLLSLGHITAPLLNLIMTLITLVMNSSLSGRLQLHKSTSFYVYFNHDFGYRQL